MDDRGPGGILHSRVAHGVKGTVEGREEGAEGMVAVKVKGVVCLRCKQRFLGKKPVEMEHVETVEAEGLDGHLVGSFVCPKCDALIGYIFEPVRVLQDGSTKAIPTDKFKK